MALTQVQGGMILPSTTLTTPIVATTMGVGGATPAASGSGITFPATQSASTNANTLDDYEEGTWTPSLSFGTSGSVTYNDRLGQYVKIGNTVFVSFWIYGASRSSPTGDTSITGLPFLSNSTQSRPSAFLRTNQLTITGYVVGWMGQNTTTMSINIINNGTITAALNGTSITGDNFEFGACIFYTI